LVRTKKLRKVKMQLSPESGNDQSTSPESGEHVWLDPAKIAGFRRDTSGPGQIRPDPVILAGSRQDQWPDPVRSGRIPAGFCPCRIPARFRRHSGQSPDVAGRQYSGGRIPTLALFQRLDDAEFQCCLFSIDRLLPDSTSQISNVRVKTKNIILENDLRF
jgi:hypothetical protein